MIFRSIVIVRPCLYWCISVIKYFLQTALDRKLPGHSNAESGFYLKTKSPLTVAFKVERSVKTKGYMIEALRNLGTRTFLDPSRPCSEKDGGASRSLSTQVTDS